ncbi:hypothetical protein ACFFUT_10005 [Pseudohalocynthiibacter aestuariivivens]|uniref:Uncharacterized protein n=1 Tax=Pseudohalocynthiibacter aestuariivivens TaxID=1591409 RepID=A0ABV5JF82_9RHOB|nr:MULTISPECIES: hypothetical protein [Pseudohalocynthiibacter]MBS9717846.1 hypothetical protein [Pseudohalocynthiibacter aestuariivivens]MCK0103005.1 hypothetical protein [Pseudohalocynthiibacter sp. F2068]
MRLSRMGSIHQCRLSFMRILLRRMKHENWTFDRPVFEVDAKGVGHAVYTAKGPKRTYSLVAFAHDLPPEMRSDRVIATAWDATFTLFDGFPTAEDIIRLSRNVPLQEVGRVSSKELSVSRANRSVRLFEHVISSLAAGHQPDAKMIESVGYLMRTTAVYGSGKLGAADREMICDRPEFTAPFQCEMLSVFLTRTFVLDLAEHLAAARSPDTAVKMDPALRRRLGIGNSTGLGMAPFLVNHPVLLNNWVAAREEALARVRSVATASDSEVSHFLALLPRAVQNVADWHSEHPIQIEKLAALKADLKLLTTHVTKANLKENAPWNQLYLWAAENLSTEGQELLVSLMMEPYGDLIDELADCMSADETTVFPINGAMSLSHLGALCDEVYGWAKKIDWQSHAAQARAWYVSEEKLEPRLGERFEEPIAEYEQPLSPARDAMRMVEDLDTWEGDDTVAAFVLRHPEHRHIVRRLQLSERFPYAEIRDNTIDADVLPIDMLRCKLAFFGATHFDPRSDRWVRINMYRNAPYPEELAMSAEDWSYPTLSEGNA